MSYEFVVVTPIYEDKLAASQLLKELAQTYGERVQVVAVDDGSVTEPVSVSWLQEAGINGEVLSLSRNVGHQKAIAVGLCYAAEHFPNMPVVTMDSDGEDTPASIAELIEHTNDSNDVVVAQRKSRVETLRFKLFYAFYKLVFKLLSGRKISFGNFALYQPKAVQRVAKMAELWIHVAATILCSKLRVTHVAIDRGPRYAGQSKMNFVGLALHGFRGLMVFAEDVLVRVGIFCGLTALLAGLGITAAVILKLVGLSSPGWFSVIIGVFLLIMFQTGILTLTTLLLTGVMKGVMGTPPDYRSFISNIASTKDQ